MDNPRARGLANLKMFQPGQSGNPKGKPKGCRNLLSEAFLSALHDDFKQHGIKAICEVRENKPDQYLKVIAAIVPKDITIREGDGAIERIFDSVSDEELSAFVAGLRVLAAAEQSGTSGAKAASKQRPAGIH